MDDTNRKIWIIVISIAIVIKETKSILRENLSHEQRLLDKIFVDYDPTVRPRLNSNQTVNVAIRFSLQQIYDLDEKRQTLTMSGWLTAEWFDEFLTWDPDKYGGLQSIVVNPKILWTPKFAIGNSANKMFHDWKYFWLTLRSNGECRWQPGGNFAFTCALDINNYPFDEQECTMEIETWFYTSDKVNLTFTYTEFGMETYLQHGEWAVVNTKVHRLDRVYGYYLDEHFPEVYFTIEMRRKYTFYFMYILLPCIMLSFVLLMMFLLPAESGEKVSLGVSILVSFSVFLIIVAEKVPDTSDAVPVIAIYLMYFMMATALSVMTSTLVLKLHYRGLDKEPPQWLRFAVFDILAPIMCLKSLTHWSRKHRGTSNYYSSEIEEMQRIKPRARARANGQCSNSHREGGSTEEAAEDNEPENHHFASENFPMIYEEWKRISEVLDRLFFWLFLFFILIPLLSLGGFVRAFKTKY